MVCSRLNSMRPSFIWYTVLQSKLDKSCSHQTVSVNTVDDLCTSTSLHGYRSLHDRCSREIYTPAAAQCISVSLIGGLTDRPLESQSHRRPVQFFTGCLWQPDRPARIVPAASLRSLARGIFLLNAVSARRNKILSKWMRLLTSWQHDRLFSEEIGVI